MEVSSLSQPTGGAEQDSLDLGGVTIDRIVDLAHAAFSLFDIYPDATTGDVAALAARLGPDCLDPANQCVLLSFHALLVRRSDCTILIDTCCGNDKHRPARPVWNARNGPFLDNLAAAGVHPNDVDLVMCTHLHADHVGWNTRFSDGRWVPTFPNAQYLFAEVEYAHWKSKHEQAGPDAPILYGSFDDSVLPVVRSGQALMVTPDHSPLQGVHFEPAPGHTPGNMVVWVEGDSGRAVCCGDVLHHPAQLVFPHWSTRFCSDPIQSRATRTRFLEHTADTTDHVLPAHFQGPSFGRIVRDGAAYRFVRLGCVPVVGAS